MFASTPFAGAAFSDVGSSGTIVFPTGVEATGQISPVSVFAKGSTVTTGVEGTVFVGTVSVVGEANVDVTGLQATGQIGNISVIGQADRKSVV